MNCQTSLVLILKFECVVRRMVMQRAGQTSSSRITNGDSSSNLEFGAINPSGEIPNCRFESGPHSQIESSIRQCLRMNLMGIWHSSNCTTFARWHYRGCKSHYLQNFERKYLWDAGNSRLWRLSEK